MTGRRILPFMIPMELAVDIDHLMDFERAESLIRKEGEFIRPEGSSS